VIQVVEDGPGCDPDAGSFIDGGPEGDGGR
jgi:hypothetical protein